MLDQRETRQPELEEQTRAPERAREWPPPGQPRPELVIREASGADLARRSKGFRDMFGGGILIAIGFSFGGSVLLGIPGPLDWAFDALGVFWLARGIWQVATA